MAAGNLLPAGQWGSAQPVQPRPVENKIPQMTYAEKLWQKTGARDSAANPFSGVSLERPRGVRYLTKLTV